MHAERGFLLGGLARIRAFRGVRRFTGSRRLIGFAQINRELFSGLDAHGSSDRDRLAVLAPGGFERVRVALARLQRRRLEQAQRTLRLGLDALDFELGVGRQADAQDRDLRAVSLLGDDQRRQGQHSQSGQPSQQQSPCVTHDASPCKDTTMLRRPSRSPRPRRQPPGS